MAKIEMIASSEEKKKKKKKENATPIFYLRVTNSDNFQAKFLQTDRIGKSGV